MWGRSNKGLCEIMTSFHIKQCFLTVMSYLCS